MPVDFIIQEFNSAVTLKGHSFRFREEHICFLCKMWCQGLYFFSPLIHLKIGNVERGGSIVEHSTHLHGHLNEQSWKTHMQRLFHGTWIHWLFFLRVTGTEKRHNLFWQSADSSFLISHLKDQRAERSQMKARCWCGCNSFPNYLLPRLQWCQAVSVTINMGRRRIKQKLVYCRLYQNSFCIDFSKWNHLL